MTQKICPNCFRPVNGHPNKIFCGKKCKDRYHNRVNPRGYFAHLAEERDADDNEHPFSSEALGQ